MNWKKLLSRERQYEKRQTRERERIDDFHDDYLAIISSLAFRRLQDKTQVFPLDRSDFVRTRLTHSMEVSAIASELAKKIWYELAQKSNSPNPQFGFNFFFLEDVPMVAGCAGLLHDTGNPPFGHYGEEVIRDWFRRKLADPTFTFRDKPVGEMFDAVDPRMRKDFENFEGNAQGLRILSKSGLRESSHDVNLTFAVMNTLIKYPNPSTDFDHDSPDVKRHKMGYYYAEREIIDRICTATGTKIKGQYVRHPLVYIMEAADDIAYATADLADAVKKGRITVREFVKFYTDQANEITDKRMKAFNDRYKDDPALYAKLDKYFKLHIKMRAASVDYKHRDVEGITRMDAERVALFQTPEEKTILKALEKEKNDAKEARNRIGYLIKEINLDSDDDGADKKTGGSVFRRTLEHSDTPEIEFAIFENWLEDMRLWLMEKAKNAFLANYRAIMAGAFPGELCEGGDSSTALHILKEAMKSFVYDSHEIVMLELSAKRIMESLLEDFVHAVMYADEPDEKKYMTTIDDRFVHMIPDNFKMDYLGAKARIEERVEKKKQSRADADAEELYLRFLMVTDFISGMTDSYALNMYRITNGLE